MNSNIEKIKIVVVGDSGVGKTTLVHLLAHQEVLKKSSCTIGCSVDVKLHEFKDGTIQQKKYFIEFYDTGGNSAYRKNLRMFFTGVDGIILVHDLTNRKSQDNLKHWLSDVIEENENILVCGSEFSINDYRKSDFSKQVAPLIVVGTKLDQAQIVRNSSLLRSSSPIAAYYRSDEINIDCMQIKYLAPGSTNSIKLAKFFDKAIEYKQINANKELTNEKNYFSMIQSDKIRHVDNKSIYNNYSQFKLK